MSWVISCVFLISVLFYYNYLYKLGLKFIFNVWGDAGKASVAPYSGPSTYWKWSYAWARNTV